MSQNDDLTFCSSIVPKPNKIFTYKGEDFHVDYDLIKRNCNYFNEQSEDIESNERYEMEESIDLSSETVQIFLACCQNQQTKIKDLLKLNYLATKYQNNELKSFIEKSIEQNYDELIFQSLSFKNQIQNSDFKDLQLFDIDTTNEEQVISSHLLEYLEDDRLFSIPISILDRILKNFFKENKEINNDQSKMKKINEFLLNCLRKYKTKASILFLNINFTKIDRDLIIRLHNEFNEIFDFNMINVKSLFDVTYDLIGEINQIKTNIELISDLQKSELNEYKSKIEQDLKDDHSKINGFQSTINELINKIQNLEEKQNGSSETIIQTLESKNKEFETKINNLETNQKKISDRFQTIENTQNKNEREISNQKQNQQSMQSSLNSISNQISTFATRQVLTKI